MWVGEPPAIAARRSRGMLGRIPAISLKRRNWATIATQAGGRRRRCPFEPADPLVGHNAVLAEVERVMVEPVEVLERRVAAQAPVGHDVVEALHHCRLVEDGQRPQLDRAGADQAREAVAVEGRALGGEAHDGVHLLRCRRTRFPRGSRSRFARARAMRAARATSISRLRR